MRSLHHEKGELRALAKLAAPVVVVQLGLVLMGAVDAMVVGHYSSDALAAVGIGNSYQWALLIFGQGVVLGLDPIVAQAHGAGDRGAIRVAFQRGLLVGAVLSALFFVAFLSADPILRALGQQPEVVPMAASFVRATAPGVPAFFAFVALRQTLQAVNVVRPVVIAVVVGNLVNLAGNWTFVYGHLGLPALGAVGSGLSTTVSRWVMVLVLALAAGPAIGEGIWRPSPLLRDGRALLSLLRVGLPTGVQYGLEVWVFMAVAFIVGHIGPRPFSAHQIAMNLASISFMVPLGIGGAAAVRVGNAVGRGDPAGARRAALVALGAGASVMLASAGAFAFFPRLLSRAYTNDASILDLAVQLLPIAALAQIFDGTQAVSCGVLRGIADTRAAAVINLVGYWLVGLPIGLVLAFPLGAGVRGLWWGLAAGLALVAAMLAARVVSRFGRDGQKIAVAMEAAK